ncbi:hypothetical protein AYO20_11058 [Fonsecaea nubica]|uniref:SMP-30/Gluconolactonase/LRE-like region domain-containing protein n=1 Tax=Fonsecaea nubica TaxID=856822 RepID=A0A178BZW7_9EURO|nr:hypothetical protein AYO20_11058 [Fonsecaea nubica]OAL23190.1 hypothetical protein AYO20_11058 [Fonsecaea nubica]
MKPLRGIQTAALPAVASLLNPLPAGINYNSTEVVFVNQKALATLPFYFERGQMSQVWGTVTASPRVNSELSVLAKASFVAFDSRFFDILGPNPTLEKLFDLPEHNVHEAPNFLPAQNKVFVSNFNHTYEYLVDLSVEPPALQNLTTDPPLESVNGGFIHEGKLVVGTDGYRNSTPPGLYLYDPATNRSEPLLNNYRGLKLSTPDDLVVDQFGQVWFVDAPSLECLMLTDPNNRFSYLAWTYDNPPELAPSIYCFNMTSGAVSVVDQSILWPNGIAFSPDNQTLYITSTPLGPDNSTENHAIVAFDVLYPHTLVNKRTVYVPDTYFADGLKVSEAGNLYAAAGSGIDVVTPEGDLLGKITAAGEVFNNLVFLPKGEILVTGVQGIWRVRIREQGIVHY